jgi:tRNA-(ms[2]io[6]A)-hydroxylase
MLNLRSASPARWLEAVRRDVNSLLIDHAHCEKKAAGTALNLMFYYVEKEELLDAMTTIVKEELDHFRQVRELLRNRGVRFRRLPPSSYGRKLSDLVRKNEPGRAVDRLLVAGLIEARSCERFAILRDGIGDAELAAFYGSLFESEARHHSTYVRLAKLFAPEEEVEARLTELAEAESRILAESTDPVRMHS